MKAKMNLNLDNNPEIGGERKALLMGNAVTIPEKILKNPNYSFYDVELMRASLNKHEDHSVNFEVVTSVDQPAEYNLDLLEQFFLYEVDLALLYFSGHATITRSGGIVLIMPEKNNPEDGISLDKILDMINQTSVESIKEIVVILDCCYSGFMGNRNSQPIEIAEIRKGVTILASSARKETSVEFGGRGSFTSILYHGLMGAAADLNGNVNVANLYSLARLAFGANNQSPIFKTNNNKFTVLRNSTAKLSYEKWNQLIEAPLFEHESQLIELNPQMLSTLYSGGPVIQNFDKFKLELLLFFESQGFIRGRKSNSPETENNHLSVREAMHEGAFCQLSYLGKLHHRKLKREANLL